LKVAITTCLSPHLTASPSAHSLGEVICPEGILTPEKNSM